MLSLRINRGRGSVEPWSFCECVSWELTSNFWRWTLLEISGLAHSFFQIFQKQMRTFRSSKLRNWSMGVWPWLLLVGPSRKLLHAMLIIFPSWRAARASFETWFIARPDRVRSSIFGFHWQLGHPIWTYCWLMLTILLTSLFHDSPTTFERSLAPAGTVLLRCAAAACFSVSEFSHIVETSVRYPHMVDCDRLLWSGSISR